MARLVKTLPAPFLPPTLAGRGGQVDVRAQSE